ncbi:MAG: hypothetical protein HGA45_18165, partial [Chloroflexales bacterium]|nr:hypothetical protein [Chloroflexales bacterium]
MLTLLSAAGLLLTGLSELSDPADALDARARVSVGLGWIGLGLAVLLWPGLSLRVLAITVGLAMVGSGAARIVAGLRGTTDVRLASLLLGSASVVLGATALVWPDVTLLVVAVLFGIQVLLLGLARIAGALHERSASATMPPREPPGLLQRFVRTVGAALALLFSLAVAALSLRAHQGAPMVDAFYRPPADLPSAPGALLRVEPFTRALPPTAQAWRVLYTTTRADGVPAVASSLVVAPANPPPGSRPVIAWAHGTTGVDETCAPSLLKDPFGAGATPALDQVIANGWVLVATDYIGLGTEGPHAYLVGPQAGRAVLDAVRAARQMPALSLSDQTVVWGHLHQAV